MSKPSRTSETTGRVRVAYLVSHPIQYQAPLLRRIAQEPDIDLTVFFGSDFSIRGYSDKGFGGISVRWDVPLVDGYKHEFLPVIRDNATAGPAAPINHGILSRLRGTPQDGAYDLLWVHGYASVNALHGIVAANALGIPVLLRSDSTLIDRYRDPRKLFAKQLFFRVLRQLVAGTISAGTLNSLYWRHYFGEDFPVFLMPYAVDNTWFRERSLEAAAGRSALQTELDLDSSRPVILFASKLQERKRCGDLLEAYLQLRSAPGADPYPYLLIVGDGDERATLEARVAQSGAGSIHFCGFRNQSELPRFFDLATVFVLPSHHEPWGLIVNEVMNAARPVILTDGVGCQPDLITDGVEGRVFPVGDVRALTAALRSVLEVPGASEQMGQAALRRIQDWDFEADVRGLRAAISALTHKILPQTSAL